MKNSAPPQFEGFEPSNTTSVPDVLFDVLLKDLNEAQLKVMLYIIRRTLGFKKSADAISLNQFQNGIVTKEDNKRLDYGCGVKNRTAITRALAHLENMGCIGTKKGNDPQGDKMTTLYFIRFRSVVVNEVVRETDYPVLIGSAQGVPPVVRETDYGSARNVPRVVRETYPQETVIQQTVLQETVIQSNIQETVLQHNITDTSTSLNDEPPKENKKSEKGRNAKTPAKAPISLPDLQGPKTPDTLLQLADYCRGRHCMTSKQKKAREAAESLAEQQFSLEQFRLVWALCSADDRLRNELGKPYLRDEGFINGGYPLDIWVLEDKMLQKLQAIEKLEAARIRTTRKAENKPAPTNPPVEVSDEQKARFEAEKQAALALANQPNRRYRVPIGA